jgi:hypothetical protein
MTNDFVYDMSQINEEEIFKGWEEMANEEGEVFLVGYGIPGDEVDEVDYIPGLDDGEWGEYEEDGDFDVYGEEEYA